MAFTMTMPTFPGLDRSREIREARAKSMRASSKMAESARETRERAYLGALVATVRGKKS